MNSTLDLKLLSEKRTISRRDLKCYVDSWTEPISACPPPPGDSRACVYVFSVPGYEPVKIGSTIHPISRRYALRTTPPTAPAWAPNDCRSGDFTHLEPCSSRSMARRAERISQRILSTHAWPSRSKHRSSQSKIEWFGVSNDLAARVVMAAAAIAAGEFPDLNENELLTVITNL